MSTIINGINQIYNGIQGNPNYFSIETQENNERALKTSEEYNKGLQNVFTDKICSNAGASDALLQNASYTLSISALSTEELEKAREQWDNHPVSALYRNDIPIRKNADDGYKIGQVTFTEEEFSAAHNLINDVGSQLKTGYLSYRDYAKMEMAEKVVEKCASENFNEEQANVIVRAMKDYNDSLIRTQRDLLTNRDYIENTDMDSGKYFGVQVSISKEVKDLLNMNPNLMYSSTDIATNNDLINRIRDSIRAIDISDKNDVNNIKSNYKSIMEPVYTANHPSQSTRDKDAVEDVLSRDVNDLFKLLDVAERWRT